MNIDRFYIDEVLWDMENDCFIEEPLKVGDEIRFVVSVDIDHYQEGAKGSGFKHLVHNVYEFDFTPVERYWNDTHKDCYHYLIELAPGFRVFRFNWVRKYEQYLKVGQTYWGYGRIRSCGDPSTENPFIDAKAIEGITHLAEIEKILVVHDNQDYFDNRCPWEEGEVYEGEDPLARFGYPEDYERVKKNLKHPRLRPKEIGSTEEKGACEVLNFVVKV